MKQQKTKNESGQLLLEILLALMIGVIMATAFVTLGTFSVRNSRFSTNQSIATKLAQEGIEAVITIRDQNSPAALLNNAGNDQWTELFQVGIVSSCVDESDLTKDCYDFYLIDNTSCIPGLPSQRCLDRKALPYTDASWQVTGTNGVFSRKIRITETGIAGEETKIKNVTVFVWWIDSNGLHKSSLTRKISKNKLGN